jgi:hypothetical protein
MSQSVFFCVLLWPAFFCVLLWPAFFRVLLWRKSVFFCVVLWPVCLWLAVCGLGAAQPDTPAMRFTHERPIVTAGSGPQRLAIDAKLLADANRFHVSYRGLTAVAQGGLSDLRLFDATGRQIPYLLVYPPPSEPSWIAGSLLPVEATRKTSGFETDLGGVEPVDMIRVDGIPAPFLKRFALEGSGDRSHWTMLVAEGTLFDLPDERLRQTELAFRAGSYRYLRVTWDDTNSGRVPAPQAVSARLAAMAPAPAAPAAALTLEPRSSEPGRSRYRIRLPGAHLPVVAIDLDVAQGRVFRRAVVNEARFAGVEAAPVELGSATLIRVIRDGASAQALRIPIAPPSEPDLELTIEDGSNPPLELKGVSAVFAQLPWIYFEAPREPVIARYGDRSARPPSYDLEAVRGSINLNAVHEANWGEPRAFVAADAATGTAPMPLTGATLDPSLFRYARSIPAGASGLAALQLDAAVLAHSRGPAARFADVRIVDDANRQIPYLVERRDEPLSIDVSVEAARDPGPAELRASSGRTRSVYRVTMPFPRLPAASLTLHTTARVFQRSVEVGIARDPDRRRRDSWFQVLSASSWRHSDQQTPPQALSLQVGTIATTELLLAIDEGDNAALPIASARLLLPSYRLRFFHPPEARLRLVYGRNDADVPQYDLALLASQVMGAAAQEIAAMPESESAEGAATGSLVSARVFWIFLAMAVLALLGLIARLIKSGPVGGGGSATG